VKTKSNTMKKPFISVLGNTEYQKWRKLWLLRGVDGVLTIAPLIMIAVALLYIETGGVSHINKLLFLGASYIAIMILRKCIIWHTNLRLNQIAFNYGLEQRRSTLEHLLSISSENFSKLHRGSISQALSDDLLWVETWYSFTVPILLVDAVSIVILLGAASLIHWPLTLVTTLFLFVFVYVLWRVARVTQKNHSHRSEHLSEAVQLISEHVKGMDLLRTFGQADTQEGPFLKAVEKIKKESNRAVKNTLPGTAIFFSAIQISVAIAVIILLLMAQQPSLPWMPTSFITSISSEQHFLEMALCILLLAALNTPIRSLFIYLNLWQMASLAINNISEIEAIAEQESGAIFNLPDPLIVKFSHVSYCYENAIEDAISDVSFTLHPNSITAIVGPSGAGKSTLLQLLMRFSDVSQGEISIAGIDIRKIDISTLLNQSATVFQETELFNDTISNNIRIGRPDAPIESIIEAAKKSCLHEKIMSLPDGYETLLGVSGVLLSGGEKQRVAIARAILKDAPIIILDEATSSLDPENETLIQSAISELAKNKTVLMIAHRLDTIIDADQIIVLEGGRVVEIGKHLDLITKDGLYSQLWNAYSDTSNWTMNQ